MLRMLVCVNTFVIQNYINMFRVISEIVRNSFLIRSQSLCVCVWGGRWLLKLAIQGAVRGQCQVFSSVAASLSLRYGSSLESLSIWINWPVSLRDLPVSSFPVLRFHMCAVGGGDRTLILMFSWKVTHPEPP